METKTFLIHWHEDDDGFLVKAEDEEKAIDIFLEYCEKSGNIESMENEVGEENVRISVTVTLPIFVN